MLKDEHQALGLAFTAMEEKYRKIQDENADLITRWMHVKAKDADKMNEDNDIQIKYVIYSIFFFNSQKCSF